MGHRAALDGLYQRLQRDAEKDEALAAASGSPMTASERLKAFLAEKQVALDKLEAIASKREAEADAKRRELAAQEAVKRRKEEERRKEEAEKTRQKDASCQHRYYTYDDLRQRRVETGTAYIGETLALGSAWLPHGVGELRRKAEQIYVGEYEKGEFHGSGELLLLSGETWKGGFRQGQPHGFGMLVSLVSAAGESCLFKQGRKVCTTKDLRQGRRLLLSGYRGCGGGRATVVSGLETSSDRTLDDRSSLVVRLDTGGTQVIYPLYDEFSVLKGPGQDSARSTMLDVVLGGESIPPSGRLETWGPNVFPNEISHALEAKVDTSARDVTEEARAVAILRREEEMMQIQKDSEALNIAEAIKEEQRRLAQEAEEKESFEIEMSKAANEAKDATLNKQFSYKQ